MKTSLHQSNLSQDKTPQPQNPLQSRPFSPAPETAPSEDTVASSNFSFANINVVQPKLGPTISHRSTPTNHIQRLLSRDDLEAWEEVHSGSKKYPKLLGAMDTYETTLKKETLGDTPWISADINGVERVNPDLADKLDEHRDQLQTIDQLAKSKKKDRPLLGRIEKDVGVEISAVEQIYKDENRTSYGSTAHAAINSLRSQQGNPSKPMYLDATKVVDDPTWENELQQRDEEDKQLRQLWQKHEKLLEKPNSQPKVRQVAKVLQKIEAVYKARQSRLEDVMPSRHDEGTGHKLFMFGFSYTPFLGSLVQFISGFLAGERVKSLEEISQHMDLKNAPTEKLMHGKLLGNDQKEQFAGIVGGVGNVLSCSFGMFMPALAPLLQGQVLEAIANKGLTSTLDTVIPVVGSQMVGNGDVPENASQHEMQDQITFELFKALRTVDKTPYGLEEFVTIMDARGGSAGKLQQRLKQDSNFMLRMMLILDERIDPTNKYDKTGEQGQAALMRVALQQGVFANPQKAIATYLSGTSGKTKAMLKNKLESYTAVVIKI